MTVSGTYEDILGEVNQIIYFDPLTFGDEGQYRCVATSIAGKAFSQPATITGT